MLGCLLKSGPKSIHLSTQGRNVVHGTTARSDAASVTSAKAPMCVLSVAGIIPGTGTTELFSLDQGVSLRLQLTLPITQRSRSARMKHFRLS